MPVLGYGTDELPAFYTRHSGIKLASRCDDPLTVARILRAKWQLGLKGGVVIANPIPQSAALDQGMVDGAIAQALADADAQGISGKEVTPLPAVPDGRTDRRRQPGGQHRLGAE